MINYCLLLLIAFSSTSYCMELSDKRKRECEFLRAMDEKDYDAAKEHLRAQVNPSCVDIYGRNALHFLFDRPSILLEHPATYREFLALPIDITAQETLTGNTSLHTCLESVDITCQMEGEVYGINHQELIQAIVTKAPQLLMMPNYLGHIPYDYVTSFASEFMPQLGKILCPLQLPQQEPILPRLVVMASVTANLDGTLKALKSTTNIRIITTALARAKQKYYGYTRDSNLIRPIGRKLVRYLFVRNCVAKFLAPKISTSGAPNIAHLIAWHAVSDEPFTKDEKKVLSLMLK